MIVFKLSMPNNNSWNGRWSGDGDVHIITKPDKCVPKDRIGKSYYYNFGDGWCACVDVMKLSSNSSEYRKMVKNNRGFCGYGWMVDSIIHNDEIKYKWGRNMKLVINSCYGGFHWSPKSFMKVSNIEILMTSGNLRRTMKYEWF